jgi:uncharacterized protein
MHNALIIFIKNPVAGKVKTRLAATIGDADALKIYLELIAFTLKEATKTKAVTYLYFSDEIDNSIDASCQALQKDIQKGDGLGERLKNAFAEVIAGNYKNVVVIGTDCPGISAEIIESSFNNLSDNEVVIGPAADGGYYLLGMRNFHPALFDDINWGTASVLEATINHCKKNKLSYKLLMELNDIDEEKDLIHLKGIKNIS